VKKKTKKGINFYYIKKFPQEDERNLKNNTEVFQTCISSNTTDYFNERHLKIKYNFNE